MIGRVRQTHGTADDADAVFGSVQWVQCVQWMGRGHAGPSTEPTERTESRCNRFAAPMVIGGIGVGLAIGWVFMKAHKYLPTDSSMDVILSLVTPYAMYLAAEELHSSGVLAVVSGGLLLSNKRHVFLS